MITHADAKVICDTLNGVSSVESLFCRCVSWHETEYGNAWKAPVPPDGGQGSNNMGAIVTPTPDRYSFRHKDSRNDTGKVIQYVTWFAGDPTPAKGFERLAHTVLHANVRAALERCDFFDAVSAMHENGYFLGVHSRATPLTDRLNVADYYQAIARACETIGAATGESQPDVLPPKAARG